MADFESNIRIDIDTSKALAAIKNLQSEISRFQTQMNRGSAAQAAQARTLQQELVSGINATGKFSASMRTVQSTAESFTSALEKNKLSFGQYFRYAAASTKTFGRYFQQEMGVIEKTSRERVKDLQTQYIKLGRDASGAMKAIAVRPLALDMNDLGTQTAMAAQKQQIMNQLLKQGSTNLLNFGKNTQWAGRQLMVGFTIPLSIFGSMAAKSFMQLEEQVIKFRKVYGDLFTSDEDRDAALANIEAIADGFTKYGVAVSDTIGLAAEAAAAGFGGVDLQRQTSEAIKLSVLGQLDQQKALETTISLQNAFGLSSEDLAESINFLNAVENQTVVALDDITTAIPKVAPVIKALGGDVKDLAFFLSAMKEGGVNASEGANALKSSLGRLINPTQVAKDMMGSLGINITDIVERNAGNLRQTLLELGQALDTLDPLNRSRAIEELFGKFQFARMSTLFDNINRDGNQASRVLDLAAYSAAELASISEKELGMTATSSMNKFRSAVENLQKAIAPIGGLFLDIVTPLVNFATDVIDNFNKLDSGVKTFVAGVVGLLGVIGPIALMTFGLLANGVANIIKGFLAVRNIFQRTGQQSQILGEQTDYLTQQQLEEMAVAASLEQIHQRLTQAFTSEAAAIDKLAQAYDRVIQKQKGFGGPGIATTLGKAAKGYAEGGLIMGPGTGTSDSIPAMVSDGEFIVSAKRTKQYLPLLQAIAAGKVPKFASKASGGQVVSASGASYNVSAIRKGSEKAIEVLINKLERLGNSVQDIQKVLDTVEGNLSGSSLASGAKQAGLVTSGGRGSSQYQLGHLQLPKETLPSGERVMGSLVRPMLPRQNKALDAGGQTVEEFSRDWNQVTDGLANTIELGGEKLTEEIKQIARELDKEIHDVAVEIAKAGDGIVTDEILASATDQVISTNKRRGGTRGRAATALEKTKDLDVIARATTQGLKDSPVVREAGIEFGNETYDQVIRRLKQEGLVDFKPNSQGRLDVVTTEKGAGLVSGAGPGARLARQSSRGTFVPQGRRGVASKTYLDLPRDIGKTVVNEVGQQIKDAAKTRSPSKKTAQAAKGMVDGVTETIKKSKKDVEAATNEMLAPVSGRAAYKVGSRRVTTDPNIAAQSVGNLIQSRDATGLGLISLDPVVQKTKTNFEAMNSFVMQSSFAFSSLSTIATMFGNELGPAGEALYNLSNIAFALSGIMAVVNSLEIARSKILAKLNVDNMMTAFKILPGKIGGLFTKFGGLGSVLSKLIPAVAVATTVFAGIQVLNKIQEDQKKKIQGLGDTANLAADKLRYLAEATGTQLRNIALGAGFSQDSSAAAPTEESRSAVDKLREDSEEFRKQFNSTLFAITNAAPEAVTAALSSMALQLDASGFAPETIAAIMEALKEESGNEILDLSFLKVNAEGALDITRLREFAANAFEIAQAEIANFAPATSTTTSIAGVQVETRGGGSPYDQAATLEEDADVLAAVRAAGASAASQIQSLNAELVQGQIIADDYNSQFTSIISNIAALPEGLKGSAIAEAAKAFGPEFADALATVNSESNQLLLLEAQAKGVEFDTTDIEILNLGGKDAQMLRKGLTEATREAAQAALDAAAAEEQKNAAVQAGLDLQGFDEEIDRNRQIIEDAPKLVAGGLSQKEAIEALTDAKWGNIFATAKLKDEEQGVTTNTEEAIQAYRDYQDSINGVNNAMATANLTDQITQLREQNNVLSWLTQNGMSVAEALDVINDSTLLAAASAALGTNNYEDFKLQLEEITKLSANLKPAGTGQKSIFQQAIDSLKEQRKEIANNAVAYSKLRDAGYSVNDAMRIAEDSTLAAALATTKVNTSKWKTLLGTIKSLNQELKSQEIRQLLLQGKQNKAVLQSQITVSSALSALGYTYEQLQQVLSDDSLVDALSKDLEDGKINAKELQWALAQIKQMDALEVELNFTTKEGTEEEFDKLYDQAVSYLNAKQTEIELDFKLATKKDQDVVEEAQDAIAGIQFEIDDYEASLQEITDQEEEINKQYDERTKALEEVQKINSRISRQQQSQLSVATALAEGDIAAAARAAQEKQAQDASDAIEAQKEALQASRERELAGIASRSGLTREQVEERIKDLKQQIFEIEEKTLEPAEERIRLLDIERREANQLVEEQIDKWDRLNNEIDLAKLSDEQLAALYAQADVIKDMLVNWDRIEDKTATLTVIKKESGSSGSSSGGSSQPSPAPTPTPTPTPSPAPGSAPTGVALNTVEELEASIEASKARVEAIDNKISSSAKQINVLKNVPGMSTVVDAMVKQKAMDAYTKSWELKAQKAMEDKANSLKVGFNGVPLKYLASGGAVTSYMRMGGMLPYKAEGGSIFKPLGTDTVPAMLTPGEFVVRRKAVKSFGVDKLNAINSGTSIGDSVYNYSLSVNVKSDANPDEIARAVMTNIKRVESQRVRGSRL